MLIHTPSVTWYQSHDRCKLRGLFTCCEEFEGLCACSRLVCSIFCQFFASFSARFRIHGENASTNATTTIDYHHPLYLYPSDAPGSLSIGIMLTRSDNYTLWSRVVKLALLGRNKLGFIDGSVNRNQFTGDLAKLWDRCNAIIVSWLMCNVSKDLLSGVLFCSNSNLIWEDLRERFDKINSSRTFQLHEEIFTSIQGSTAIFDINYASPQEQHHYHQMVSQQQDGFSRCCHHQPMHPRPGYPYMQQHDMLSHVPSTSESREAHVGGHDSVNGSAQQDLISGNVREIGKEEEGLYTLYS